MTELTDKEKLDIAIKALREYANLDDAFVIAEKVGDGAACSKDKVNAVAKKALVDMKVRKRGPLSMLKNMKLRLGRNTPSEAL